MSDSDRIVSGDDFDSDALVVKELQGIRRFLSDLVAEDDEPDRLDIRRQCRSVEGFRRFCEKQDALSVFQILFFLTDILFIRVSENKGAGAEDQAAVIKGGAAVFAA